MRQAPLLQIRTAFILQDWPIHLTTRFAQANLARVAMGGVWYICLYPAQVMPLVHLHLVIILISFGKRKDLRIDEGLILTLRWSIQIWPLKVGRGCTSTATHPPFEAVKSELLCVPEAGSDI